MSELPPVFGPRIMRILGSLLCFGISFSASRYGRFEGEPESVIAFGVAAAALCIAPDANGSAAQRCARDLNPSDRPKHAINMFRATLHRGPGYGGRGKGHILVYWVSSSVCARRFPTRSTRDLIATEPAKKRSNATNRKIGPADRRRGNCFIWIRVPTKGLCEQCLNVTKSADNIPRHGALSIMTSTNGQL
jgi:hypothetical protein